MELLYSHVARRPQPHLRSPQIPEALSAIIMKLFAKAPEEPLPKLGLRADLTRVRAILPARNRFLRTCRSERATFPTSSCFRTSCGREKGTAELLRILESVRAGQSCLTLISGYSGVGKSVPGPSCARR